MTGPPQLACVARSAHIARPERRAPKKKSKRITQVRRGIGIDDEERKSTDDRGAVVSDSRDVHRLCDLNEISGLCLREKFKVFPCEFGEPSLCHLETRCCVDDRDRNVRREVELVQIAVTVVVDREFARDARREAIRWLELGVLVVKVARSTESRVSAQWGLQSYVMSQRSVGNLNGGWDELGVNQRREKCGAASLWSSRGTRKAVSERLNSLASSECR